MAWANIRLTLKTSNYININWIFLACLTIGGKEPGKACKFPFKANNEIYYGCAETSEGLRCSTKNDEEGNHINGHWGICSPNCPVHGMQSYIWEH